MRRRTWIWRSLTLLVVLGFVTAAAPHMLAGHGKLIKDDDKGSCPSGFAILVVANHAQDWNGNGIVCQSSSSAKTKTGTEAAAKDDVNGSCPSGLTILGVAGHPKDRNGNGIVCQSPNSAKNKPGTEAAPNSNQAKADQGSPTTAKRGKEIRIKDDSSGVCPPDFTPIVNAAGYPKDENGNGVVCIKFE